MGKQRTGDEHIMFDGMPIGHLLSDYWAWNSSDLLIKLGFSMPTMMNKPIRNRKLVISRALKIFFVLFMRPHPLLIYRTRPPSGYPD